MKTTVLSNNPNLIRVQDSTTGQIYELTPYLTHESIVTKDGNRFTFHPIVLKSMVEVGKTTTVKTQTGLERTFKRIR